MIWRRAIHKYPLNRFGETVLAVPEGSEFLSAKVQNNILVAYFNEPKGREIPERVSVVFSSIPTGVSFDYLPLRDYVDTFMLDGDKYVVHLFKPKRRNTHEHKD